MFYAGKRPYEATSTMHIYIDVGLCVRLSMCIYVSTPSDRCNSKPTKTGVENFTFCFQRVCVLCDIFRAQLAPHINPFDDFCISCSN